MLKTNWFSAGQKPEREGVYERDAGNGITHYARWDGERWLAYHHDADEAAKSATVSAMQHLPWRGLLQEALL